MFAGSNLGNEPIYAEAAAQLGRELARRELELVHGKMLQVLWKSLPPTIAPSSRTKWN